MDHTGIAEKQRQDEVDIYSGECDELLMRWMYDEEIESEEIESDSDDEQLRCTLLHGKLIPPIIREY